MKLFSIGLVLLALAVPASADIPMAASIQLNPSGGADVDLGFFFDSLSPYGNWVDTPSYGWSFVPTVDSTWRPYSDGQWIQSDAGWTWLTDEPFGWATYHYGRWDLNPDYGWMWVPGDQWAPAWVDWRATDDVVGWAPLPPSYAVSPRLSFRTMDVNLPPEAYLFVPETRFLQPQVVAYALPPGQAKKLFRSSRRFTRYRFANNLIINEGVPFVTVQRRIGRRIPRYQLVDLEPRFWRQRANQRARFVGNRVEFFRPRVLRTAVAVPPARPFARRSVMRVADAVRVRRVARDRAVAFSLPPPRIATVTRSRDFGVFRENRSRRDFGHSRGIGQEVSRIRSRRDFGHTRGIGRDVPRPVVGRDFGQSRGVGKGKKVVTRVSRSRRDLAQSRTVGRGVGKDVRKQQLAPRRGVRLDSGRKTEVRRQDVRTRVVQKNRGRAEVRHSPRGEPTRQIKAERRSSSRSKNITSGGGSHKQRQSVRQSSRSSSRPQQRAVRQDRGGGGRQAAVRGGGGGRQGGKRGGGRGQ